MGKNADTLESKLKNLQDSIELDERSNTLVEINKLTALNAINDFLDAKTTDQKTKAKEDLVKQMNALDKSIGNNPELSGLQANLKGLAKEVEEASTRRAAPQRNQNQAKVSPEVKKPRPKMTELSDEPEQTQERASPEVAQPRRRPAPKRTNNTKPATNNQDKNMVENNKDKQEQTIEERKAGVFQDIQNVVDSKLLDLGDSKEAVSKEVTDHLKALNKAFKDFDKKSPEQKEKILLKNTKTIEALYNALEKQGPDLNGLKDTMKEIQGSFEQIKSDEKEQKTQKFYAAMSDFIQSEKWDFDPFQNVEGKTSTEKKINTLRLVLQGELEGFDEKSPEGKAKIAADAIPKMDNLDKLITKYTTELDKKEQKSGLIDTGEQEQKEELIAVQKNIKSAKANLPDDIAAQISPKELGKKIGKGIGAVVAVGVTMGLGVTAAAGLGVAIGASAVVLGPAGPAALAAVGVAGLGAAIAAGTAIDQYKHRGDDQKPSIPKSVIKSPLTVSSTIASKTVGLLKKTGHIGAKIGGSVGHVADKGVAAVKKKRASKAR